MEPKKLKTNTQSNVTGVTTSTLKSRFNAGSIPLDTDFNELIDIAECGRRAVGQSADQSDNTIGAGLMLSTESASIGKISVLAKSNSGITVDSSGVGIKCGPGVMNSGDSLAVKAKSGSGITVSNDGVGIDQAVLFPKGMIMMYYDNGSHKAPAGWAICDGKNGTPDLTYKFVMGGLWAGETNNKKMAGSNSALYTNGTALGAKASIDGNTTEDHVLMIDEMPKHMHTVSGRNNSAANFVYWSNKRVNYGNDMMVASSDIYSNRDEPGDNDATDYDQLVAHNIGSDVGHSHNIKQSEHKHDVQVEIPYYTLMYIMKI